MPRKSTRSEEKGNELQSVKRLLAMLVTDGKKQKEQVRLLSVVGFDRHEIADLLSTTPLTVSVLISNMRKEGIMRGKKHRE